MGTLALEIDDADLASDLLLRVRLNRRTVQQEAISILREATRPLHRSSSRRLSSARAIAALAPREQSTDSLSLLREERSL